jgi:hypothetical protein
MVGRARERGGSKGAGGVAAARTGSSLRGWGAALLPRRADRAWQRRRSYAVATPQRAVPGRQHQGRHSTGNQLGGASWGSPCIIDPNFLPQVCINDRKAWLVVYSNCCSSKRDFQKKNQKKYARKKLRAGLARACTLCGHTLCQIQRTEVKWTSSSQAPHVSHLSL